MLAGRKAVMGGSTNEETHRMDCGSALPVGADRVQGRPRLRFRREQTASIPFQEDQLYAVAYLGYGEINDLAFYTENYLDDVNLPVHYLSKGDYYLIIPRYADMEVRLYRNDIETMGTTLIYEEMACRPFILQCNISDIFTDATICLTRETETVEFSPYISLEDGSVQVGDRGVDITK